MASSWDLESTTGRPLPLTEISTLGTRSSPPMPVHFTLDSFPTSASVKNATGLPWAAVVTPFTSAIWRSEKHMDHPSKSTVHRHVASTRSLSADSVPRCEVCGGWLNATCMMQRDNWHCTMCNYWNQIDGQRPVTSSALRGEHRYPEMNRTWCEFNSGVSSTHQIIAHVLILDLSIVCLNEVSKNTRRSYLQAVRDGMVRAITNMSKGTWVTVLCVDNSPRVTLCDVRGMRRSSSTSSTSSPSLSSSSTSWTPPRLLRSFVNTAAKGGNLTTSLVDMLQGSTLACNVSKCRSALIYAITSLIDRATFNLDRAIPCSFTAAQNATTTTAKSTKAAIYGVLEYLSSPPPSSTSCRGDPTYSQAVVAARIAVVTPGWDVGTASSTPTTTPTSTTNPTPTTPPLPSTTSSMNPDELRKLRKTMATCGVCLDIYHGGSNHPSATTENNLTAQLMSLSLTTGGRTRTYDSTKDHHQRALRDDLASKFGCTYAACGIIEIRTSEGFRVSLPTSSNSTTMEVGWREPTESTTGIDEQIHLAGCDRSTCFPISFTTDVVGIGGSSVSESVTNPIVQLSFVYCTQGNDDSGNGDYSVQRWTRVITVRCGSTANAPRSIMLRADTNCIFYVLTHQVVAVAMQEEESAATSISTPSTASSTASATASSTASSTATLVTDWLVYLLASYHRNVLQSANDSSVHPILSRGDRSLSHLSSLTQLVFGLCRRLERNKGTSSIEKNKQNGLVHLLSLTPNELVRNIYPVVNYYNKDIRTTSIEMSNGGEPYISLSWSTLFKNMNNYPKNIIAIDSGTTIQFLRNGALCTPVSFRKKCKTNDYDKDNDDDGSNDDDEEEDDDDREDPDEERATIMDHYLQRRRATSTISPMIYTNPSENYIEYIKNDICIDDGNGIEKDTYRYFCEQLKSETVAYLKNTAH